MNFKKWWYKFEKDPIDKYHDYLKANTKHPIIYMSLTIVAIIGLLGYILKVTATTYAMSWVNLWFIFVFLICLWIKNIRDSEGKSIVTVIALIHLVYVVITLMIPHTSPTSSEKGIQPDTTYITFSPTCKYCNAAKVSMHKAVHVYNQFNENVVLVNIDEDTKLAKELNANIESKGVVIHFDEKMNYTQRTYPLSDKNLNPVTPSPEHIYNIITDID